MKRIHLVLVLLIAAMPGLSQNFETLYFGDDTSLDIMSWNIEWFPKDEYVTPNDVSSIIAALEPDIIAIQEIDDTTAFKDMVNGMPDYAYSIYSSYFMGLAYMYKPSSVQVTSIYEIYTEYEYWNIFPRSPLVMEFTYNGEAFTLLNNHLKCCGDGEIDMGNTDDEEYRRYMAADLLEQWISTEKPNQPVILTGDMNDVLTDEATNNVFQFFLDAPGEYAFTDMLIAEGSAAYWSYPTWPSHLDHIMITDELFDAYANPGSACTTILVDEAYSNYSDYDESVSDHRPMGLKLKDDPASTPLQQTSHVNTFPNPANDRITISGLNPGTSYCLRNAAGVKIIESISEHSTMDLDLSGLLPGTYSLEIHFPERNIRKKVIII
jgi:endonuclease/exonuclease/phosphatase family metal-dependent hydrolase